MVRISSNPAIKEKTNLPDWSALVPVLPGQGPRTQALYEAIRRLIEAGTVPPGAKLPPTRDLAARLRTSRISVVAAFERLVADGFATARVGAGTFVSDDVPLIGSSAHPVAPAAKAAMPLPGTLGVATADERTLKIFRTLLSRHLARPTPEHFHYGDPRGGAGLRETIAAYLRTARGVRCDAEHIVVTTGTQQGLDLFVRSMLKPGDGAWIEDPCYPSARAAFEGNGIRLQGVPVDAEGLDPEHGAALMPGARAVYVTPSHQFPLGVAMTMRRRLALIEWARRNDAWIVEDDYDSEFRYAGPPLTAMQGLDASGRVVYLGTFSKVLLPGLRIGYAVLPDDVMKKVIALRARTDRFPSTLAEAALTDLIRGGHLAAHLRRARRKMTAARDALIAGLEGARGLTMTVPEQGLHLLVELDPSVRDTELVEVARSVGFGVRALSAMAVSQPPRQGLVIGFSGFSPEALFKAANALRSALERRQI
ncbi:GntR family transcriptional regulator/MocR family aminotransferase [Mycoplana sp. BE70]|uniref:MocR-like pyridoxine biosynthesis transcription factor PdxR n=1 Tax=Mycoplana sp. BE70 TaxID=2817775 RepID=UPI0028652257|nr:PLP-dependent aminotransferase family protein [Mycoplana sp. BE70]MDR6757395.1 GntR family transcriptional regulator/MocR family aminotransferase [Mycoplana sp. BE70]